VGTWITIAAGILAGLLWRRFATAHPYDALADMLLGITGAFAARWFIDVLRHLGMNRESYGWVLVLAGAALLPWSARSFYRRQHQIHQSRASVSQQEGSCAVTIRIRAPKNAHW